MFSSLSARSQLVINEVSSANSEALSDEFGDSPDWIELYNGTSSSINLNDYYLSDNSTNLTKWQFPSFNINAGDFLLLLASGRDTVLTNIHTNFKLERKGESLFLRDNNIQHLDSVAVPRLRADDSYGRSPDGGVFNFFKDVTPNMSNSSTGYSAYAQSPVFITRGGFFNQAVMVEITNPNTAGEIRFEQGGKIPSDNSSLYSSPIDVLNTTVLTCVSFVPGMIESDIVSSTYLINERNNLPTISISGAPHLLFSDSLGIFELGNNADSVYPFFGANYWQDWEVPVFLEYYSTSGEQLVSQLLGMKIHGGRVSRTNAQKSVRLIARNRYGDADIDYPMFPHKPFVDEPKHFILRNAGGDFEKAHIRDPITHRIGMNFGLDIDMTDYQPAEVFINAEYYGVMNIREKLDEFYLRDNYGVDIDDLDFLEEDTITILGSFAPFDSLHQYILSHDMSNEQEYLPVEMLLDVKSCIDYFLAQTFYNNSDWPQNNLKLWRERNSSNSKWRYIYFDLDAAYDLRGWTPVYVNALENLEFRAVNGNKHAQLLLDLLENESVLEYFLTRYADLLNTVFSRENQMLELQKLRKEIDGEMFFHNSRWSIPQPDYERELDMRIPDWMQDRPQIVRDQLKLRYFLEGQFDLNINVYPPGSGSIQVNTITPESYPWQGVYFDGVPVTLTAIPGRGNSFVNWTSQYTFDFERALTVKRNYKSNDRITAYFVSDDLGENVTVYPNPVQEKMSVSFLLDEGGSAVVNIYSIEGRAISATSFPNLTSGRIVLDVDMPAVTNGMYVLVMRSGSQFSSTKFVVE